jgi:hypothetical protein
MLRLNTKLTVKSRIAIKCDKHIRYNPEKDGRDGVKGNCSRCLHLLSIYNTRQAMLNAARDYEQLTQQYELVKPRTVVKKPVETSPALDKAFKTLLPQDEKK